MYMLNYISTIKNLRTRGNKMTQLYQNLTSLPSIKWPNRSWDQSLKCHTSPPPKPWGARGRETSEFRALYWRSVTSPSLSPLRPQRVRGLRHVTFRTTVTTKSIRQNKVTGPSFVFDFVIDVKVFFYSIKSTRTLLLFIFMIIFHFQTYSYTYFSSA